MEHTFVDAQASCLPMSRGRSSDVQLAHGFEAVEASPKPQAMKQQPLGRSPDVQLAHGPEVGVGIEVQPEDVRAEPAPALHAPASAHTRRKEEK